jgi:beta-galactosidase
MDKPLALDHLTLGVCYYPEHWDESLWENDLDRMLASGIETVRVFEFAWSIAEPREGCYDFSFFDRFLTLAAVKGMRVILCTPTATPPAWLTFAHPEVLNSDKQGNLMHHGHRRHYNYTSPVYLAYTEKIVTALARRYGTHPAVIGWQIDNEVNCEINEFYSASDRTAFRAYLQQRFGTLNALNDAIGARFWNQTYTDWQQVDMERTTLHNHANPHMALLEKAFFSHSAISYIKLQSDILRAFIGSRFITTNGFFGHVDNYRLTRDALDFMTYDSYPNFGYGRASVAVPHIHEDLRDRASSLKLSMARSMSPNFGVMEQQSGANGWDFTMIAPMPKPGQMRLWTYQSVAHGADFISYFRWRTAVFGTEIYWHGLNDYDNRPNRRTAELERVAGEFKLLPAVAGSRYRALVAVACDYLNEWDGERDQWHGPLDSHSRMEIFKASQFSHTPMDTLPLDALAKDTELEQLLRYKAIIYPHATILSARTAEILEQYCRAGGTLIMGARTGYKDEFGRCRMMPMPGYARALCGAEVADYTFARPEEPPVRILWNGAAYDAPIFHDILSPVEGGEALACFEGGYYSGMPALIRKRYLSGGAAYYLGAGFAQGMVEALLRVCGVLTPYAGVIVCPPQVELACRTKDKDAWYFALNYSAEPQTVNVIEPLLDTHTGKTASGQIVLEPYGVKVLRSSNMLLD